MNKRDQISIYINNSTRYYLLCRIVNMGDSRSPDLKFTDVSDYGYITKVGRYDGAIKPEDEIDFASKKVELSYHKDGSPLYKSQNKGNYKPWYSNFMQPGFRQIPINDCSDILPLINFQIRRPEIYKSAKLDTESTKRKVYICTNKILFTEEQQLFAVIYVRHKHIPLTRISTNDYYSDILARISDETDLCIFICRHSYPAPKPYYDLRFKRWITPYPCNSVSFCNQKSLFDEMVTKLHHNIFDGAFATYINILGDGELFHLTEEKLLVLDEIDIFFEGIVNPVVHKPEFTKFVFEIFKYNPQEFISKPFQDRQMALKAIWDTILYEGKQRNWFK